MEKDKNLVMECEKMKMKLINKEIIMLVTILLIGSSFLPIHTVFAEGDNYVDIVEIEINQINNINYIDYIINEYEFDPLKINNVEYYKLIIDGESNHMINGYPDLPTILEVGKPSASCPP